MYLYVIHIQLSLLITKFLLNFYNYNFNEIISYSQVGKLIFNDYLYTILCFEWDQEALWNIIIYLKCSLLIF